MARSLDEIFGNRQNEYRTLDEIFAPPAPERQTPDLTPLAVQMRSSHESYKPLPTQIPDKPPSTWQKIKVGDIKSLAKDLGVGIKRGISKADAVKQNEEAAKILAENPLISKFASDQLESVQKSKDYLKSSPNNAATMAGEELTKIPLWVAGEGVAGLAGKGLSKLAPSLSSKVGKLPSFIKGGVKDAGAYSMVVAPAESIREGESFSEFLDREKMAPGVLLGGTALRGVGAGVKLGRDVVGEGGSLRQALELRKLSPNYREMNDTPIEGMWRAYEAPTLRDARANQYEELFSSNTKPMTTEIPIRQPLRSQPLSGEELLVQRRTDAQNAFGGPLNNFKLKQRITPEQQAYEARQAELNDVFKDLPIGSVSESRLPTLSRNQRQSELQKTFNNLPNQGRYSFTTGEQRALNDLQEGIQTAQNYIGHTDVLAGYPPGTTVEQAYADIAKNTGVDLPKLMSNWEKAQAARTSLTPQELALGRTAGVIPNLRARNTISSTQQLTETLPIWQQQRLGLSGTLPDNTPIRPPSRPNIPLKQREIIKPQPMESIQTQRVLPEKPEPLTWTNRENIQSAGPLPLRSITEENLGRLPRYNPPLKTPTRQVDLSPTTDVEIPVLENGRLGRVNERPRTMAAEIEGPDSLSIEPIRPRAIDQPNVGNAETFRAKIDRNPASSKPITQRLKELRTQFVDDLAPLENTERAITGKLSSAEDSLYKQGRLFRGSPERADELIRSNLAPIIKRAEKSGSSTKDLGDYALAVHARDVNAKGINSGFTDAEIDDVIRKLGTPEMEQARKELVKISNDNLDALAEAGIIDRSLVAALREKHPNYMPLFRSFDDDKVEFATGLSKALANVTVPIERLKGSNRNVVDPIESMIKNIYRTVSSVDRNKVAAQLGKLADKDTNGLFVRRLAEGEERARLNSVYAMENGKKVYYDVQPDVYRAIMNLDKESSNILIRTLQKPASLLRAGATLTPEFSLRNPIRDVPTAFSVSNSGLNPVTDIPRALFDIIRSKAGKETLYNQFLKDNAGFGNIISMDRKMHQEVMRDILPQKASDKFVNIVKLKPLLRVLRGIADVSESATKLGEYRAALRSGASRPEAAYRARDIMDFGRAGASVRETNKIVAFLNANIQGKSKIYRAIKEDPVGVMARSFASVTVPTIGVYMAQKYLANDKQKETINDAPEWLTSTFWLLPVPGTDQVARIPKPFDMAPAFANLPERALKYLETNDSEAFEGFAKETMASSSIPTMITGLIPFIEGMANYSFFRQSPIIPQREANLNYSDQYDINTTGTAKALAKGMEKITGGQGTLKNFSSPRIMDNTIKGTTAGLGAYATSAIDYVAETLGLADKKQKPARNLSELPLLRAFLVSDNSGGKSMDKFYDEKGMLTKNKSSLKLESPKAKFPEEKRLKKLNDVSEEISNISKEIRKIENNTALTPLQKRDKINSLKDKRNALTKGVMGK